MEKRLKAVAGLAQWIDEIHVHKMYCISIIDNKRICLKLLMKKEE